MDKGWEGSGRVSYEAARNYHYDREPTIQYMVRVADVFDVSLEWLTSGKGHIDDAHTIGAAIANAPPTSDSPNEWREKAQEIRRAVYGRKDTAKTDADIPYWVAPLFDVLAFRNLVPYEGSDAKQLEALGAALRAPLDALGFTPDEMEPAAFRDYIMTMVPVLFGLARHRAESNTAAAREREREEQIRRAPLVGPRSRAAAKEKVRRPRKKRARSRPHSITL